VAVTAVNAFAGGDDVNRTTYTTASYAFLNDHLYLVSVHSSVSSGLATLSSVTGGGITWHVYQTKAFHTIASPVHRVSVAYGRVTSGASTGTLSLALSDTDSRCDWTCDEWSGEDTSGVDGLGALVQNKTNAVDSSSTALTVTLDSAIGAGNATWGVFGVNVREAVTAGSGYTALGLGQPPTEASSTRSIYKSAGDTTPNVTYAAAACGGIAIEIKAAAAGITTEYVAPAMMGLNSGDMVGRQYV